MLTRLAGALLCRDPRCDCWPLPDLSGEAARGMASLRVDAALLEGEPVVRGAAARSFGKAALGDRGGIPFSIRLFVQFEGDDLFGPNKLLSK